MASAKDDPVKALDIDLEKIAAAYSSEIISYYDIINVEKPDDASSCSGLSDSPHLVQWATLADWHDLAYQELLSMNNKYLHDLVNIKTRVEELLSQGSESVDKYDPLKIFLEELLKFLALSKDDIVCLSKNKCYMLISLIKSFVAHFEDSLSSYEYGKRLFCLSDLYKIPELQQHMIIKVLCTNSSLRSEPAFSGSACQSEWVRLDDWHDLAHRELTSIRRVYLPQLLKAYKGVCGLSPESPELGTNQLAVKIFLLEFCKFLTLSRAEIVGLSKGECYVFMMIIKNQLWQQLLRTGSQSQIPEMQDEMDIRVQFVDPSPGCEPASSDPLNQIQPEWVVRAHQELESLRIMYSAKLDKIHKEICELWSQNSVSQNKYDSCRIGVASASNYLALSRAGIYDLYDSEEKFNEGVRLFKEYLKLPPISEYLCGNLPSTENARKKLQSLSLHTEVPDVDQSMNSQASTDPSRLIQFKRFTNLNDQLFEEIQVMKKKYVPGLLRAYNKLTRLSSKTEKHQKERYGICTAIKFLEMPRCLMAIITRDYYEVYVEFSKSVIAWNEQNLFPAGCSGFKVVSSFGYCEVKRNRNELD